MQATSQPAILAAMDHIGFMPDMAPKIAIITLGCAVLLVIPATAPVGALLTTAFLGGAVCSHARIGEVGSVPQILCIAFGLILWAGLILADPRAEALFLGQPEKPDAQARNR